MAEIIESPNMSKALEEYGRKKMMLGSIEAAKNCGLTTEQTVEQLCEIYGIDGAEAEKLVCETQGENQYEEHSVAANKMLARTFHAQGQSLEFIAEFVEQPVAVVKEWLGE